MIARGLCEQVVFGVAQGAGEDEQEKGEWEVGEGLES